MPWKKEEDALVAILIIMFISSIVLYGFKIIK